MIEGASLVRKQIQVWLMYSQARKQVPVSAEAKKRRDFVCADCLTWLTQTSLMARAILSKKRIEKWACIATIYEWLLTGNVRQPKQALRRHTRQRNTVPDSSSSRRRSWPRGSAHLARASTSGSSVARCRPPLGPACCSLLQHTINARPTYTLEWWAKVIRSHSDTSWAVEAAARLTNFSSPCPRQPQCVGETYKSVELSISSSVR